MPAPLVPASALLLLFGSKVAQQGKGIRNEIISVAYCIIASVPSCYPRQQHHEQFPVNPWSGKEPPHSQLSFKWLLMTSGPAHQQPYLHFWPHHHSIQNSALTYRGQGIVLNTGQVFSISTRYLIRALEMVLVIPLWQRNMHVLREISGSNKVTQQRCGVEI